MQYIQWGVTMGVQIPDFNKKIEIMMAENDVSMSELSRRTGMLRQTINTVRKSKTPRPKTVKKIANALRVRVSYFYE